MMMRNCQSEIGTGTRAVTCVFQPLAPLDPLSRVSVLGLPGGERAVVFHAVHSREQRMGNAPR